MTSAECRQFSDFIVLVNQTRLKSATQEDEVEVPEEYLGKLVTCFSILISCRSDPILYTVMEDPVILPSSQIVIDRKTIRSHLLSDSTDPFNRAPLSVDDLIGWSHQDNTCIALNFVVQKILTWRQRFKPSCMTGAKRVQMCDCRSRRLDHVHHMLWPWKIRNVFSISGFCEFELINISISKINREGDGFRWQIFAVACHLSCFSTKVATKQCLTCHNTPLQSLPIFGSQSDPYNA